jgi:hypothetical protein
MPKYRRVRPDYIVHPDGLITVEQKHILPGKFGADEEDMNACDDRLVPIEDHGVAQASTTIANAMFKLARQSVTIGISGIKRVAL